MTTLPQLDVGTIVHVVGMNRQLHGRHLPAIVVRIVEGEVNRVVLTIFTDQVKRGAASSTRREASISYSAEMASGTWHHIEKCHRRDADTTTT